MTPKSKEKIKLVNSLRILFDCMYCIYEDHIELLEEENADLKQEVVVLRQRLEYYKMVVEEDSE